MNWHLAITRNRTALLAVVAAIITLLGGRDAAAGPVARRLRNAALALLRPAESAARRLIVIAARGVEVAPRPAPIFAHAPGRGASSISRPPAFRLFDRPKRFVIKLKATPPKGVPRIRSFWSAATPWPSAAPILPSAITQTNPDAPVDGDRLHRRINALERALADLPHQARRLARWQARDRMGREVKPGVTPHQPLRLGRPPGWRARPDREVDLVLRECHALALQALSCPPLQPDTS
jgi:hypothetical protein